MPPTDWQDITKNEALADLQGWKRNNNEVESYKECGVEKGRERKRKEATGRNTNKAQDLRKIQWRRGLRPAQALRKAQVPRPLALGVLKPRASHRHSTSER